jgi:hypothetical protein
MDQKTVESKIKEIIEGVEGVTKASPKIEETLKRLDELGTIKILAKLLRQAGTVLRPLGLIMVAIGGWATQIQRDSFVKSYRYLKDQGLPGKAILIFLEDQTIRHQNLALRIAAAAGNIRK